MKPYDIASRPVTVTPTKVETPARPTAAPPAPVASTEARAVGHDTTDSFLPAEQGQPSFSSALLGLQVQASLEQVLDSVTGLFRGAPDAQPQQPSEERAELLKLAQNLRA
ncbi:MAG: hypothetical protein K1X89_11115 [Myxococcaceae bacterium]|nr:hypothetical protein [Myxococcaceae bacterium]